MHVGYIHYSRPCRARDAGAARAETRTAHRRTLGARREDERCRSSRYAVCERGTLDIIISNGSSEPIYEQITSQIKAQIMSGALQPGEALPSMRALAKSIHVSVITVQKAYDTLQEEGFIETTAGKGCYVAPQNQDFYLEEQQKKIEEKFAEAITIARASGISLEKLTDLLSLMYEEDE